MPHSSRKEGNDIIKANLIKTKYPNPFLIRPIFHLLAGAV